MKLQINTRGAWRDVLHFDSSREPEVRIHAQLLLDCSFGRTSGRIVSDNGLTAIAHCIPPFFDWKNVEVPECDPKETHP